MELQNLYRNLPDASTDEVFETLVTSDDLLIERIVSHGQITPEGEWYDQERSEWVMLLQGAARLMFDDGREVELLPGDSLNIRAHHRHRVSWTDPDQPTIWLAVHYPD